MFGFDHGFGRFIRALHSTSVLTVSGTFGFGRLRGLGSHIFFCFADSIMPHLRSLRDSGSLYVAERSR